MLQNITLKALIPFLFFPYLCFAENSNKTSATTPDFSKFKDVSLKKQAFFDYMAPFVQQANQAILEERKFVLSLNFHRLNKNQRERVAGLITKYRLKYQTITPRTQKTLLKKIDVIPSSLALAQAANESSWGTSRFAVQANNYFGQWCFEKGCGLVPLRRPQGQYHEVKKFPTPFESVQNYMLILNNHPAFKPMREIRHEARKSNQSADGLMLAQGLEPYSELRDEYVQIISSMIRSNRLNLLDS